MIRREFLRALSSSALPALLPDASALAAAPTAGAPQAVYNVRDFGALGDGTTLDSPAVNRAIAAAAAAGGGTVFFPAGVYACYTLRLRSHITLELGPGATVLAAPVPQAGTTTGGYDPAGPPQPWEAYQDFGHNHWPNSLIFGEGLEDIGIVGPGLIWGKGLSRGEHNELPLAESPGVGNKAIALKNCRNVRLRNFSILMGGHFAILLTGVDNVLIDALTIDTNRDGIDIDCCRNVRVSNCAVNSPWDDAICPKSSFALGYARPTENVTISNCYVTGAFEYGSLLSGKFVRTTYDQVRKAVGRIKCGTESNGGFLGITVTNCILEGCRGFALETVDGAIVEDITVSNLVLRGVIHSPILLRLGARLRGPAGIKPGVLRRISFSNIVSTDAVAEYPSIVAGIAGYPVEDIRFSDIFLGQRGGGSTTMAALQPPERPAGYPEADMFGPLPVTGFFLRHARNLQFSNVEIATAQPDTRPAIWAAAVEGLDVFRLRVPPSTPGFNLNQVKDFRSFGSARLPDHQAATLDHLVL